MAPALKMSPSKCRKKRRGKWFAKGAKKQEEGTGCCSILLPLLWDGADIISWAALGGGQ